MEWKKINSDLEKVWINKKFPKIFIKYVRTGKDNRGNNTGFFCVFRKENSRGYREFRNFEKAVKYAESIKDKNEADKDFYRFKGKIFHDINSNHG